MPPLSAPPPEGKQRGRRKVLVVYLALMFCAVPVWWKTTEIYRAPLPFHLLKSATQPAETAQPPSVPVRLAFSPSMARSIPGPLRLRLTDFVRERLGALRKPEHAIAIEVLPPAAMPEGVPDSVTTEGQLDAWLGGHAGGGGVGDGYSFFLLSAEELGGLVDGGRRGDSRVVMGVRQHGWLAVPESATVDDKALLKRLDFLPRALHSVICESAPPTALAPLEGSPQQQALAGASLGEFPPRKIRLSLSLLVEGTPNGAVGWDIEEAERAFLRPFAEALKPVYDVYVDSQILYHATLAVPPVYSAGLDSHTIPASTLNDFINSKDWVLDATSRTTRTFHLLLFVPSKAHTPLNILDTHGNFLSPPSFLVAGWGGVCVFQPGDAFHALRAPVISAGELKGPMEVFIGQLRLLLGVDPGPPTHWVRALADSSRGVSGWQLKLLERSVALSRIARTRATLGSLEVLINGIPNMRIQDEIAQGVSKAIVHVLAAEREWAGGGFSAATAEAAEAADACEAAFFHPTMLSMLYFPDDHKMAVYIPYFVPVLLPVVVSLLREAGQMKKDRKAAAEAKAKAA